MNMKPTIYLAGPISGLEYDSACDWRVEAIEKLAPDIVGLSPMRGKMYLKEMGKLGDTYEDTVLSCQRGIMTRDFFDCTRADALIVNFLGAERVSIGTVMEVAWAFQKKTPVIAIMEKEGNLHDHGMVREAIGFRVTTLDEAINVAKALLTQVPH